MKYLIILFSLSACTGFSADSADEYASYNCRQLAMEKHVLEDEMQQANGEASGQQIMQLAMAAFAMSNGQSYHTRADSSKADALTEKYNAVRHEAIRKQCSEM